MSFVGPIGIGGDTGRCYRRISSPCTVHIKCVPKPNMAGSVGEVRVLSDTPEPVLPVTERVTGEQVVLKVLVLITELQLGE